MSNRCPACGYENREQARFCAECGRETRPQAPAPAVELLAAPAAAEAGAPLPAVAVAGALALDSDAPTPQSAVPEDGAADGQPVGLDAGPEPGDWLADRYYVLGYSSAAGGPRVYAVEDRGTCRACGAPFAGAEDEPFCTNCGVQLASLSSPWPRCQLQELEDGMAGDAGQHFTSAGRTFALLHAGAADEPGAVSPEAAPAATVAGPLAGGVTLVAGQRSDVGDARAGHPNEDSMFALTMTSVTNSQARPSLGLYIVADGMGGHLDGDVASRTACGLISASLLELLASVALQDVTPGSDTVVAALEQAIQAANRQIFAAASAANSNMGTTLVLALAVNGTVYVANVGDSRAYHWSGGGLRQITEDHSHVFLLLQNGVIEEDEIYTHPRRNEIYRSLGSAQPVEVDYFEDELAPGDLLLLCSDGLWEMLRNEGIADVLLLNLADPQTICDELVRRANGAGGDDNISVVVVRAVGGGRV